MRASQRAWFFVAVLPIASAAAEPRVAHSGTQRTALLELFTSEGCSSCPSADAWLHDALPSLRAARVVPIALHVDYWNELGWIDPYSDARYTARQHRLAAASHGQVYTPELTLNGRELRRAKLEERLREVAKDRAPELSISVRGTESLAITATVKNAPSGARLYLAAYERSVEVDVPRGENARKHLVHDVVVRRLVGPLALDAGEQTLTLPPGSRGEQLGVLAFLEAGGATEVLQVVSVEPARP